tara:strand:+ start:2322 stop:3386 length:1065 start_codon:yes stop_codon:yes gene_type:complete
MKALVLAGGKGTRLRPLTHTMPKQLVPVANRPVVHYVIDQVVSCGITDIGIVVSPDTGDQIRKSLHNNPWNADFTYITQDAPLGLAHAVKISRDYLRDDSFLMYLGDNLVGGEITKYIQEFDSSQVEALILLKSVSDPRLFGVAEIDEMGTVLRLIEKPEEPPSTLALMGIYVFSPYIHMAINQIQPSPRGELEITDAIQQIINIGRPVKSFIVDSWWLDTGKKDDLLEANKVILGELTDPVINGCIDQHSEISGTVKLSAETQVIHSYIEGPTDIGAGTLIKNSTIGPFTSIGNNCTIQETTLSNCVILDNAQIIGINGIEDSIVGRSSVIKSQSNDTKSIKLMVGDDNEVLL